MATTKQAKREQRKRRIRSRVSGTPERPRLAVYRSNRYFYAQLIDDSRGMTLAAISTRTEGDRSVAAKKLAEQAKSAGVSRVVFDRGGFLYEGTIKAFADAVREAGLEF